MNLIPIIKFFVWKLIRNLLLTRDNLRSFGMDITGDCPFRNKELETTNHLFITCDSTHHFWSTISQLCPSPIAMNDNIIDLLEYIWTV